MLYWVLYANDKIIGVGILGFWPPKHFYFIGELELLSRTQRGDTLINWIWIHTKKKKDTPIGGITKRSEIGLKKNIQKSF